MPEAKPVEPRNWFYVMVNVASVTFVLTALAYAVVPVLEEQSTEPAAPSPFHEALRENGWLWLLIEAGLVAVFAFCSMALDHWRLRK